MSDVTLAILAGGEGSRMGKPKGLLTIHKLPILEFLLNQFAWPGPTLLVTAPGREYPPGCNRFDNEVTDPVPDQGPLRGILTALEQAKTNLIVFATVDMPLITSSHLQWLTNELQNNPETFGLMTARIIDGLETIEPFPSAFRKTAVNIIQARLASGLRSLHSLKNEIGFQVLPSPQDWPPSIWTNLNNPREYDSFLKSLP